MLRDTRTIITLVSHIHQRNGQFSLSQHIPLETAESLLDLFYLTQKQNKKKHFYEVNKPAMQIPN